MSSTRPASTSTLLALAASVLLGVLSLVGLGATRARPTSSLAASAPVAFTEPPTTAIAEAVAAPEITTTSTTPSAPQAAARAPDPLAGAFPAAATPIAPPAPPVPPPAAATGIGVWAVVIGIDDYPGSAYDLRDAVADANETSAALRDYGVPDDHKLVLRNSEASAFNILSASDWLVEHAGPTSTAVFAYAGHMRAVNTCCTEAIVAADGRLVPDYRLAEHLKNLQAKSTWFMLASCYSGGFTEVLGPGRVLTAASKWNELAYESDRYGHSYFVEYMVRQAMRQGFAPESVQSAFNWAYTQIHTAHPGREPVMILGPQADAPLILGTTIPAHTSSTKPTHGHQPPATNTYNTTTTTRPGRCVLCVPKP